MSAGDAERRSSRPAWSAFRAALDAAGFHPSRRLGQNFLLDENLCSALVRDAEVEAGTRVLEVGAGCGFLTAHLAAQGARVLAVEIDRRLFGIAAQFLAERPEVELLHADALAGKRSLAPELLERLPRDEDWMLVANLPYSIAAPLIALLAELDHPPRRMSVLIQREVADRILAPAGSPGRGPLAVKLEAAYTGARVREVGPELFWPRPKVESTVLRLDRRPAALDPAAVRALDPLLRALFQHRRQSVGRVLGVHLGERRRADLILAALGIDPKRRPGDLELAEIVALQQQSERSERLS